MAITAALCICIVFALLFGVWAIYLAKLQTCIRTTYSLDYFLTARGSMSGWKIGWSFLSASIGAWILFVPSKFSVDPDYGTGWPGLLIYSFFSGAPILLIGYLGIHIKKRFPSIISLGDYARQRFGKAVEIYISLLILLSAGKSLHFFDQKVIGLTAEYTALGDVFVHLLGTSRVLPVVCIGLITLLYTVTGGLSISIITHQYQGIFSYILVCIIAVFVAFTFDPSQLPELPNQLKLSSQGISSIVALCISWPPTFLFADSMWQRIWASEDNDAVKYGSILGSCLIIVLVFTFGFLGFLATWAGISTDPDLAFISLIADAPSWIVFFVALAGVALSQSAINSYQHGITGTITSLYISLGFKESLFAARVIEIVVNIPIIFIGLQELKINSLYLIMNILTTTAALPLFIGLIPQLEYYINASAVLVGCSLSLASVIMFGYFATGSFFDGIFRYFFETYSWEPFVIALFTSVIGVAVCICLEVSMYACAGLPYISDTKLSDPILHQGPYKGMSKKESLPLW